MFHDIPSTGGLWHIIELLGCSIWMQSFQGDFTTAEQLEMSKSMGYKIFHCILFKPQCEESNSSLFKNKSLILEHFLMEVVKIEQRILHVYPSPVFPNVNILYYCGTFVILGKQHWYDYYLNSRLYLDFTLFPLISAMDPRTPCRIPHYI